MPSSKKAKGGPEMSRLNSHGYESFCHRALVADEDHEQRLLRDRSLPNVDSSINSSYSRPSADSVEEDVTSFDHGEGSAVNKKLTPLQRMQRAARTAVVTNQFLDSLAEEKDEEDENESLKAIDSTGNVEVGIESSKSLEGNDQGESKDVEIHTPQALNIQGDSQHKRNAGSYTIIAFVNSGSGGGMGHTIYTTLQQHLGSSYVFDLKSCRPGNMPEDTLLKYARDPNVRVLSCGGDGTMGWILSCLDKVWSAVLGHKGRVNLSPFKNSLPLAIMPLGTGNDLSRQFGWGGKFQENMKSKSMIMDVEKAAVTHLDRWRCIILPMKKLGESDKNEIPKMLNESLAQEADTSATRRDSLIVLQSLMKDESPLVTKSTKKSKKTFAAEPSSQFFDGVFCNYFSLGFDATIAYLFHHERENHPEKFTSPLKNKMIYVQKSPAALRAPKLRNRVEILVNDKIGNLVKLKIPKSCRAIILMNIQSYGGGNHLTTEGNSTDGLIEVIFVSNLIRTVASLSVGPVMPFVLFKVAAQTDKVCIRTKTPLHCQVDGEPWLQGEGVIQIKFHSRNAVLRKNTNSGVDCNCWGGNAEDGNN